MSVPRAARPMACAALAALLLGCASPPIAEDEPTAGVVSPPTDAGNPPEGRVDLSPSDGFEATAAPPAAGAPSPALDAKRLTHLERDDLLRVLGSADFSRRDGPAEMLQYKNEICILDVFLYRERADGPPRVLYVEARNRRMEKMSNDECLTSLLQSRRGVG